MPHAFTSCPPNRGKATGIIPGMTANNVIFMQAAVPASCFDSGAATLTELTSLESPQKTPDGIGQWGYRGLVSTNVNATLYNIYNPNDYALGWWVVNQERNKPEDLWHPIPRTPLYYAWQSGTGGSLNYWDYNPVDNSYDLPGSVIRAVTDPQESISFIARSRTAALGTMETHGSISAGNNFDVGTGTQLNFNNLRPDHSGEFTRPIQQLYPFYKFIFDHVE